MAGFTGCRSGDLGCHLFFFGMMLKSLKVVPCPRDLWAWT